MSKWESRSWPEELAKCIEDVDSPDASDVEHTNVVRAILAGAMLIAKSIAQAAGTIAASIDRSDR